MCKNIFLPMTVKKAILYVNKNVLDKISEGYLLFTLTKY